MSDFKALFEKGKESSKELEKNELEIQSYIRKFINDAGDFFETNIDYEEEKEETFDEEKNATYLSTHEYALKALASHQSLINQSSTQLAKLAQQRMAKDIMKAKNTGEKIDSYYAFIAKNNNNKRKVKLFSIKRSKSFFPLIVKVGNSKYTVNSTEGFFEVLEDIASSPKTYESFQEII
ncbi:hypothetical protein [Salinivibrio sharmensis]|uniref:Phage protein n=1 Tax=Salinivibrio sharmensis TaxID=390883 RepID=A0ABX3KGM3_9GAMM|nr:hypothetical protein [Salinivibrio sharmensis]OOE88327.1 hypothetical protein BZG74_08550 [Salinivibrio sharmensis]